MQTITIRREHSGKSAVRRIRSSLLLLCFSCFSAALLCTGLAANAQPLDTLVHRAIERHPAIAATQLSVARSETDARAAGAWDPPRAGVEISMLPPLNPNPFTRGETMFMVEQEFPLFGQKKKMADAMRAGGDVRGEELAATARELRARVETEYYQLILLERRAELNRQSRALAEILYADAETRYRVNGASQGDIYLPAIEIERLDAALRAIRIQQQTAQTAINTLLLQPPGDTIILSDTLPLNPLPPFEELVEQIEANPELKKMDAMARMNEAEAVAALGMLDPMLMVRGGVAVMPMGHPVRMAELGTMVDEFHAYGDNSVERLGLAAGVMLSIPLAPWSRSGPEARAEGARLQGEEALARKAGMRRDMVEMLRREYAMAQEAQVWIEHYRTKQIPLLEQSLKTLRTDYMNGRTTISSLVDVYRMLTMAQEEIAMREAEYGKAWAQIKKMTSGE